jgi:hypothetical protein
VNGVTTGTRLERLLTLRNRINLEIEAECLSEQRRIRMTPTVKVTRDVAAGLPSPLDIKRWAFDQGLIVHIPRGRVSARLTEAYVAAHADCDRGAVA